MLAALLLAALPPWVHPWPIGVGPRYHPAPAGAAVRAGRALGSLHCAARSARFVVHVEVFARRRVAIVPAGVGRGPQCVYPLWTSDPTGVVRVAARGATLGDLFTVWGQALGRTRLLSFRDGRGTLAFVGGRRVRRDPRTIRLTPHAQIVIEIGGYVPPHPSYLFPKGTP
jgi:hypothetical protein